MGKKQSLGGPFTTKDGIDLSQMRDDRAAIPGDLGDTMLAMQMEDAGHADGTGDRYSSRATTGATSH